jgi:hypothetical protein
MASTASDVMDVVAMVTEAEAVMRGDDGVRVVVDIS